MQQQQQPLTDGLPKGYINFGEPALFEDRLTYIAPFIRPHKSVNINRHNKVNHDEDPLFINSVEINPFQYIYLSHEYWQTFLTLSEPCMFDIYYFEEDV